MANLRRRGLKESNGFVDSNGTSSDYHEEDEYIEEQEPEDKGLQYCLLTSFFLLVVAPLVALAVVIITVPSPVDPEYFELPPIPRFEGALAKNTRLNEVDKLFLGKFRGPESLAFHEGHMYTGVGDGRILDLDIEKEEIRTVVQQLGRPPCGGLDNEPHCGRPLGIRMGRDGFLYVVDAYLGLWKVDPKSGATTNLMSGDYKVDGKRSKFLNDLEIDSNGLIYITDSSSKFFRTHHCYVGFESRSYGRLYSFNPKTNETTLLLGNLYFANGVQLSKDETYLLITEMARSRVTKYYVAGPKRGQTEIFADNLPGLPDNIRPSSRGGWWVALAVVRHPDKFSVWDTLSTRPWIRNIMAKIFHRNTISQMVPKYGLIVELDARGRIIDSLHDINGTTMPAISEVEDRDGVLYLASFFLPFLGRIDMNEYR